MRRVARVAVRVAGYVLVGKGESVPAIGASVNLGALLALEPVVGLKALVGSLCAGVSNGCNVGGTVRYSRAGAMSHPDIFLGVAVGSVWYFGVRT